MKGGDKMNYPKAGESVRDVFLKTLDKTKKMCYSISVS